MVKKEGYLMMLSIIAIIAIVGIVLMVSGTGFNTNCNAKKDKDIIGMAYGGLEGDNGRQGETSKPGIVSNYLKIKQAIKGVVVQSPWKKAIKKIEIPEQKDSVPPEDCDNAKSIQKNCEKYIKEGDKCYQVQAKVEITCKIYKSCTFEDIIEMINSYDITGKYSVFDDLGTWEDKLDSEITKKCKSECKKVFSSSGKVDADCDKVPVFDKVFCEWECE